MDVVSLNDNFKSKVFAIVGASNNTEKYGFKVFHDLKVKGFKVVPINLHESFIDGVKAFKSVLDVPFKVDWVVFIVPPNVAFNILNVLKDKGFSFWFQPGSESSESKRLCEEFNLNCVFNTCIMRSSD